MDEEIKQIQIDCKELKKQLENLEMERQTKHREIECSELQDNIESRENIEEPVVQENTENLEMEEETEDVDIEYCELQENIENLENVKEPVVQENTENLEMEEETEDVDIQYCELQDNIENLENVKEPVVQGNTENLEMEEHVGIGSSELQENIKSMDNIKESIVQEEADNRVMEEQIKQLEIEYGELQEKIENLEKIQLPIMQDRIENMERKKQPVVVRFNCPQDDEKENIEDTQMTSDTGAVKKLKEELAPGSCKKRRKSAKGTDDIVPVKRGRKPLNKSRHNSDSEDTSEHSNTGSTNISSYGPSTPRPLKYNFLVEFDPTLDSAQRIEILTQKIDELRKTYADVTAELAAIDRKNKKKKRREREALKTAKQELTCA